MKKYTSNPIFKKVAQKLERNQKFFFEFLIQKLSKQNLNFSYFMYLVSHVGIMMAYVFVVS